MKICDIDHRWEGVLCGMQNFEFEQVYFAEFYLRNVPQITPQSFSTFCQIQIKSNNQLCVGSGLHSSLELTSTHHTHITHKVNSGSLGPSTNDS